MVLLSLSLIFVGSEKLHNYIYREDDESLMVDKLFRTLLIEPGEPVQGPCPDAALSCRVQAGVKAAEDRDL